MPLFVRSLKFDRVLASCKRQSRYFDYYSTDSTGKAGEKPQCSTHSNPPTALPKPQLNYRDIAENAEYKSHNAYNRNVKLVPDAIHNIASLWREHKDVSSKLNAKRNQQNLVGETIRGIRSGGAIAEAQKIQAIKEAKVVKKEVSELEVRLGEVEEELLRLALAVPNDTHPASPLGPESAASTLSTHGPSPISASPERDHLNVGRTLQLLDFEAAALATGTSWYYLKNEGALLEMALTTYALSVAIQHGFKPFTTPDVVRAEVAARCGFHPRDHPDSPVSQMYHIAPNSLGSCSTAHPELVLAGTAEIPLAALFAGQTLADDSLPFKFVGVGRAFRPEAGARGTESRGLYRVHQFTKVELFAVTRGEDSEEMMEEIRRVQVELFEGLGLSLRSSIHS
jgi:seryl-tRNA synthetase